MLKVEFECSRRVSRYAAIVSLPSKLAEPFDHELSPDVQCLSDRVVTATLVNAHTHLALSSFLGMGQSDRIAATWSKDSIMRWKAAWTQAMSKPSRAWALTSR